jgi:hypothetical protein
MDDYDILCSEKNIILKRDKNNFYYLSLEINENNSNENTIYDVITNDSFFELLFELNKDILEKYNISDLPNNYKKIFYSLNLVDNEDFGDQNINLLFNITTKIIDDNKCSITSNNDLTNFSLDNNSENVFLNSFSLDYEKDDLSKLSIKFKLDEYDDFKSYFISMYIKKTIYRIKKYFE